MFNMKLIPLFVVFGLALLAAEARFIDRSVLSEGDVIPRSIGTPTANDITDDKLLPEIDTTTAAAEIKEGEITLQEPQENTDNDNSQVAAEFEEKLSPSIETTESNTFENIDNGNKLEKTIDIDIAAEDGEAKDAITFSENQLIKDGSVEEIGFKEKLIEASTTQEPPIKLEDATAVPTLPTLAASSTVAPPPEVDFYKPLKPFYFPSPVPPTLLLSKPLSPPQAAPSVNPFNELATSESVVGLGLVLLPNPFYFKRPTEQHVHSAYPTAPATNGINDNSNNKKVQFNPIYFYLDSNHVQHALSQFTGDANKETSWVPPFMLYANKKTSPQENKFSSQPDLVKDAAQTPSATTSTVDPIVPLNEQTVLFAVEIPQPIYKIFKSFISLFSI